MCIHTTTCTNHRRCTHTRADTRPWFPPHAHTLTFLQAAHSNRGMFTKAPKNYSANHRHKKNAHKNITPAWGVMLAPTHYSSCPPITLIGCVYEEPSATHQADFPVELLLPKALPRGVIQQQLHLPAHCVRRHRIVKIAPYIFGWGQLQEIKWETGWVRLQGTKKKLNSINLIKRELKIKKK